MKRQVRGYLLMLLACLLVAGCGGTLRIEVVSSRDPTPTPTRRARATSGSYVRRSSR